MDNNYRAGARHPLATACDQCHRCKIACDGRRPTCNRCAKSNSVCTYSTGKPLGKPKGSKNHSKLETRSSAAPKSGPEDPSERIAANDSGKRKLTETPQVVGIP
jgi:hypothetical protein